MVPFNAREVDAPLVAVTRRRALSGQLSQDGPRQGDFHRPALVDVAWVVQRALDMHRRLEPFNLPAIVGRSAVAIRLLEKQVPARIEGVDFELAVIVIGAVRIDEELKVIVLKNNGIVLRERAPDVRLFHVSGNVKILVIVEHFVRGCENEA